VGSTDPVSSADPAPTDPNPTSQVPTAPVGTTDRPPELGRPAPGIGEPVGSAYPVPPADPVAATSPAPPPVSSSTPTTRSEPVPAQEPILSAESVAAGIEAAEAVLTTAYDDATATASSVAGFVEDMLDKAGELTSGLAQAVSGALGALLGGGTDGAPKPVKEMIEQVANVVGNLSEALGALLGGGDGGPAPAGQLVEQVANVMGNLSEALGALLVGGADRAPGPATNNSLAQPFAFLYDERTTELFRGGGELVGQMVRAAADEALGGGGLANQHQQAGGEPVAPGEPGAPPPAAPLPALPPLAPGGGGSAPVGYSSSFLLGASGSSASDGFQLLFAILVVFSVALLQGGKLSWQRGRAHGPPSAPILAIERPG
jgi:hypothetical protein